MPSYPPRNKPIRKNEIYERKVFELIRFLESDASTQKINNAAEKVRTAKLNLLKAKLHLLQSFSGKENSNKNATVKKKILSEKQVWINFSAKEIIEILKPKE